MSPVLIGVLASVATQRPIANLTPYPLPPAR